MSVSRIALSMAGVARSSGVMARGMATGTVKWFNQTKGFGFITPDDASQPDLFVHQTAILSNGFRYLKEGEKCNFDVQKTDKGLHAQNVTSEAGKPFEREPAPVRGGEQRGERKFRAPRSPRDE